MKKLKVFVIFILIVTSIFGSEEFFIKQGDEELKLEHMPKNIVTDSAIMSRFLGALDIDLVGVPTSTSKIPEKYSEVEKIGRSGTPDLEVVKNLGTDLVISTRFSKPALKPKYDALNIPSVYLDVESYSNSKEAIKILGSAFHKEKRADEIIRDWEKREKELLSKVDKSITKKIAIIYGNGESFFMTGKEHFLEELVEKINVQNVVTSLDAKSVQKKSIPFSLEQLVVLNPDIILIMPNSQTKNGQVFIESFDSNPIWQLTKAYKNKKIHIIDPTLFRMSAGVNSIDALEELYRYVYEE